MTAARTKLKQALLLLLDTEDFEQLSISQICKEAGVHRSTFYAHYDNQYQLLEDTRVYMIDLFLSEFENYQKTIEAPKEKDSLMDSYYLVPYLQFIKDHQKLYKIYIKNPLDFQHKERDDIHFIAQFIPRYQEREGRADEREMRYRYNFYTAGIRQMIEDWVLDDCQDEVEDLVAIIQDIIF